MKIQNKLTGEINIVKVDEDYFRVYKDDGEFVCPVTLKELNDGWKDYEEPKEYWYIDDSGGIMIDQVLSSEINMRKSIDNYFTSLEGAEKAVEKLKAWKRLKDNGLVIKKWNHTPDMHLTTGSFLKIEGFIPAIMKNMKDLDLLFGGEE